MSFLLTRLNNQNAFSNMTMLLTVVLLGIFVHSFMVTGTFKTMDDMASIVNNELIKDTGNALEIMKTSYFGKKAYWRPLVFISYMIDYALFGLNPYYYYLVNLFIHVLSSVIIFFLIRLFFVDKWTPFFTALTFAVHPIHWEAVSNIPGRSILLSALFSFLAFYLFCLHRRKKNLMLMAASLASFGASLLSKESGVMLPVLVCSYLWFAERPAGKRGVKTFYASAPFFAVLAAYILTRKALGMVSLFHPRTLSESLLGFATFLRSFLTHIRSIFLPFDLHFDRSIATFTSFHNPELIITAVVFIVLTAGIFLKRNNISGITFFFLSWFCIDFIPVSQLLVSIGTQAGRISTAEHFLYSASVGVFVLCVRAGQIIYEKNKNRRVVSDGIIKFVAAGAYVFLALTTIQQNIIASSELAMLKQSLRYNPDNARMMESYGFALVSARQYEEGEKFFREVLKHNPGHIRARISLGKALCDQGRCAEGMLEYDKVHDARELSGLLEQNKKATYAIVLKQYETLLAKEPGNAQLHYSLGIVYARSGRLEQAIASFQRAIALKPDHKEALFNAANVYEGAGKRDLAREYYQRVLAAAPENRELDEYAKKRLQKLR